MTTLTIALFAWYAVGGITTAALIPTVIRGRVHRNEIEARREEIRAKMIRIIKARAITSPSSWSVSRLYNAIPANLFDEHYAAEINRGSIALEVLEEGEALGILYRRPSNRYTFFYTRN